MLTNFLVGVTGSLITLLVAPLIQNHFWHYQRRTEIQLRAIEHLNELAAQLIHACIYTRGFAPNENYRRNLMVVSGQIKALFSEQSYARYKEFEAMFIGQGSNSPIYEVEEKRDSALKALYDEVAGSRVLKAIGL